MRLISWRTRVCPTDPAILGRAGEKLAARHLKQRGCRVVARNLRTKLGELDLVALAPDRRTLVLVEVKTRALRADASAAPPPEAAITARKRKKLALLARQIIASRRWHDRPVRIDVIAIDWPHDGKPILRHYENAIRG